MASREETIIATLLLILSMLLMVIVIGLIFAYMVRLVSAPQNARPGDP